MILPVEGLEVELRDGTVDDVPLLLSFFHAMATFEKLPLTATEESLRDALFGEQPAARVLFAYTGDKPIAYVIYFFTFGSMVGKRGLWLDDLYIDPAYRGKGIGQALMAHLAEIAIQNNCSRFEWMVLDWNENAIRFYEKLGATVHRELLACRVDEAQLAEVARRQ